MNKTLVALLTIAIVAVIGYMALNNRAEAPTVNTDAAGGTILAGEEMDSSSGMIGGDAMPGTDTEMESDAMKKVDTSADAKLRMGDGSAEETEANSEAAYLAYSEGVIGNGEPSLLFFHAAWCPNCRVADRDLASIYTSGNAKINTYKVDYDTATELKERYGVTYQHTFVLIDGQGQPIRTVQGANATQLEAMING